MKLNEMTFNRADAIDICMSIGKRFAEHFDKIYQEHRKTPCFSYGDIRCNSFPDGNLSDCVNSN